MDKNLNYYQHSIIFCIKCHKTMYITNYYQHLKSNIHKKNLEKKKLEKNEYLIKFN
jgi:hypothetical protein